MNKQRLASTALAALALAAFSPVASAASTWNFGSGCSGSNGGTYGNVWTCGSGDSQVWAQAWSTAEGDGDEGTYRTAELERYSGSGFGVRNREWNNGDGQSPEHATDNQNGTDLIALSFAQSVTLSSLSVGWWQEDSDLSVLAYTGAGTPSLSNMTAADLLDAGSGWTLVGNYASAGATSTKSINSGNFSSSWWLISAYNSNFGGSGLGQGNDYVKLLAVAGTRYTPPPPPPGVPEPGTLALAGIALAGAWQVRRRKTSAES